GVVYEDGTPEELFEHPQRERTRQFICQIHETTFLIKSEHFDWYAMMAQMEQFCKLYNLSRQQTDSVLHVVEETLTVIGTASGTRLTVSYAEQENELQLTVCCPQVINPDIFHAADNDIAMSILRNFSRDINIDGNTIHIVIK
ncbi:MAG: hypothetical protein J5605_02850, partial [Bacteroidales bacterium]|nr:hypothetical protein [Bacteroidales bacterium]